MKIFRGVELVFVTRQEVGFRFYTSNKTNMKTNKKQIYFGSYRLCDQVGRGKGTQNQYCTSYNEIPI